MSSQNKTSLPVDISKCRVLDSSQASELIGFSLPHFRRLYRAKKIPPPIRIGERKYGWRAGELIDWLNSKAKAV
jgi:predicted DNA-binding transcriptional regulator AlpA